MFNTSASRRGALAGSTLALSVALALIAAPSAHAVEGPAETVSAASTAAENNDAANPVAPLQALGDDESIASVMSPSGCAGQTDYAHVSGIRIRARSDDMRHDGCCSRSDDDHSATRLALLGESAGRRLLSGELE